MIEDLKPFTCRDLPEELVPLIEIALDVRWTWNHSSDNLWKMLEPEAWETTRNPWWMLQSISQERLIQIVGSDDFRKEFERLVRSRNDYMNEPGWYQKNYPSRANSTIAYFSMEFGLGEAIPLYAGGLGILAGDYLKTASDLGVPMVGVGLLYQQGYFRQVLARDGTQIPAYPPNDPICLPLRPVTDARGGWLRVPVDLPGRQLVLRTWKVQVGRVMLYLLDSNDPTNNPTDRSIIYKLYEDEPQFRLMQEIILGIGGWKLLDTLGIHPDICHFNEGHTAFVVLERARSFMKKTGQSFPVALWATRAGNVFTTHTAVASGFDSYPPDLIEQYFSQYASSVGITLDQLLALGRQNHSAQNEPFNMAVLAMRGCIAANGVSRLHGRVSRQIFQSLFPRWPQDEVPVGHVTNGVHMPSWDSQKADQIWTNSGGRACWCRDPSHLTSAMQEPSDEDLWSMRVAARHELVNYIRWRIEHHPHQDVAPEVIKDTSKVLDPDIFTIGFGRRFAPYKRPTLLLHDQERLIRILNNPDRPVQLIVGGKAHPKDEEGKRQIQEIVKFSRRPEVKHRVVFLPDYEIELAQELVKGMDLWISTSRRPWEACGTSGMKVLVNGGLNLSELDGWWAEAYEPDYGWSIGDGHEHDLNWDSVEAEQLYYLLENEIIPEYYSRNEKGVPLKWVSRMRSSMCCLAPQFSSSRMLRDYIAKYYHPAGDRLARRISGEDNPTKLYSWQRSLQESWGDVRFGSARIDRTDNQWRIECEIYTGALSPRFISVEIYAAQMGDMDYVRQPMKSVRKLPYPETCYLFRGSVTAARPADHYSLRIVPASEAAVIPLEDSHIMWKYPIA